MTERALKPILRNFEGSYISIDRARLKECLRNLTEHGDHYFSASPDAARYSLTFLDGVERESVALIELPKLVDRWDESVLQFAAQIYVRKLSRNLAVELLPKRYLSFSIDVNRKKLTVELSDLGAEKAKKIFSEFAEAIMLFPVNLPEAHRYLERHILRALSDHPNVKRNVFLIIRLANEKPLAEINQIVRHELTQAGLSVLRADDKAYTDDLWDNVMTYMYSCECAVAVFDNVNYREFNSNVAIEVGFMLSQQKRVLLLKDRAIEAMPTDIVGKIYRSFDSYDLKGSIPPELSRWVRDCNLVDYSG